MDTRPSVEVIDAPLPYPLHGCTDGRKTVWLHTDLTHRERRVALAHELSHIWHSHTTRQPLHVEHEIDVQVARSLLPDLDALVDALAAAGGNIDVAADDLAVTPRIVRLRLDTLLDYEARHVRMRAQDHDHP